MPYKDPVKARENARINQARRLADPEEKRKHTERCKKVRNQNSEFRKSILAGSVVIYVTLLIQT